MERSELEQELRQVQERIELLKAEIYRQDGIAGYLQSKLAAGAPAESPIEQSEEPSV